MRTIRLCHGRGDGVSRACLATAVSMVCGEPERFDAPSSLCPLLRLFIICTNDRIPESLLGEIYGPLIFELPGTAIEDRLSTDHVERAIVLTDTIISIDERTRASLTEVQHVKSIRASLRCMLDGGAVPREAVMHLLELALRASGAHRWERLNRPEIWRLCAIAIRRAASIGDRRPVETVLTPEQLADRLNTPAAPPTRCHFKVGPGLKYKLVDAVEIKFSADGSTLAKMAGEVFEVQPIDNSYHGSYAEFQKQLAAEFTKFAAGFGVPHHLLVDGETYFHNGQAVGTVLKPPSAVYYDPAHEGSVFHPKPAAIMHALEVAQ